MDEALTSKRRITRLALNRIESPRNASFSDWLLFSLTHLSSADASRKWYKSFLEEGPTRRSHATKYSPVEVRQTDIKAYRLHLRFIFSIFFRIVTINISISQKWGHKFSRKCLTWVQPSRTGEDEIFSRYSLIWCENNQIDWEIGQVFEGLVDVRSQNKLVLHHKWHSLSLPLNTIFHELSDSVTALIGISLEWSRRDRDFVSFAGS